MVAGSVSLPGAGAAEPEHRLPSEHGSLLASAAIDAVAAPELVYLLVTSGLVCLALSVLTPGWSWHLLAAPALLLIGGAGMVALPVHPTGALMLSAAAACLLMEARYPGFGLHAAGAVVGLLFAGLNLTGESTGAHAGIVVPLAAGAASIVFVAGRRSWRLVRDRPFDASRGLVGRGTVVLSATGPRGHGVVSGEVWELRAPTGQLREGQSVRVVNTGEAWLVVAPVKRDSLFGY